MNLFRYSLAPYMTNLTQTAWLLSYKARQMFDHRKHIRAAVLTRLGKPLEVLEDTRTGARAGSGRCLIFRYLSEPVDGGAGIGVLTRGFLTCLAMKDGHVREVGSG